MQVFKVFFKVMSKKKTTMCIYILIYLMISVTIGYSMKEHGQEQFSKVSVKIAVENLDQGELGAGLVSYLGQHHQLQEIPTNRLALQDAMYYQEIDYVLAIPKDFTEKFQTGQQEGILEGTMVPGSRAASFMEQEIQQYLNIVSMYQAAGMAQERALELAAEDMEKEVNVDFLEKSDGQELEGGYYFFQYIPYVFLVLMILVFGSIMKTFQDKDLSARNKCSAMSFWEQNVQIILGSVLFTFGVYLLFMGMACLIDFSYLFSLKGLLSAINALVFSICAISVAWFCVQFVHSSAELNVMSNIFSLSFSFLGGVFVSLELMGDSVRQIAKFIPSYWYVIANQEIQKVENLAQAGRVYQSFGLVLAFALAFFSVGLLVKRMKLKTI